MQVTDINPLTLPSVSLDLRSQLPTTPCIYFAIDSEGRVQYIGKSNNPRNRWQSHHKGIELALIGRIRIAYLESEIDLLPEIERALIAYFCPPLNQAVHEKPTAKDAVKVRRSIDVEAKGLGEKIKEARKADGRPVEVLASEAEMSRTYWHDIEAELIRDALPEETLRKIERVLNINLGVKFDD